MTAQSSQIGFGAQLFFAGARARFAEADQVSQLDTVEFAPDMGEPMADIAAQDERIVRGLVVDTFVGYKFQERHGGDFDLLEGHLVELGDRKVRSVLDAVE